MWVWFYLRLYLFKKKKIGLAPEKVFLVYIYEQAQIGENKGFPYC